MRKLAAFIIATALMITALVIFNKQPPEPLPSNNQQVEIPTPKPSLTFEQVLSGFSEQRIRQHIDFLCSKELAGRMSGHKGNEKAAAWAVERFREYGLEPGFGTTYLQTFKIQNLNTAKEQGNGQTSNIVGILKGGQRCIVIGAHIDHIGYGPSMSRAPSRREIHPGADDNASSVAALMEIAKAFTALKGQNKHTIVFIAFSAEEMGLIGADHYVSNPTIPLSQVDFMFNSDMIGRSKGGVSFLGANSLPIFRETAKKVSSKINVGSSAGGGSDHASFARKGIPVMFAHTGLHGEYHTPDDTPDRLNFDGIRNVAQWIFHCCWLLDKEEHFPRLVVHEENSSEKWYDHDWRE